jgi:hypothetical protein
MKFTTTLFAFAAAAVGVNAADDADADLDVFYECSYEPQHLAVLTGFEECPGDACDCAGVYKAALKDITGFDGSTVCAQVVSDQAQNAPTARNLAGASSNMPLSFAAAAAVVVGYVAVN